MCACWAHISLCSYADFAAMFKAELFNPDEWASVIKRAGAKCEHWAIVWQKVIFVLCLYTQTLSSHPNTMRDSATFLVHSTSTGIGVHTIAFTDVQVYFISSLL